MTQGRSMVLLKSWQQLKMARFRDAKVCNKWLQKRFDDHRIQSDCEYKIQKERNLYLVLRLSGDTELHQ